MGIKDLNKLLRNNCPEVFETVHLSKFAYKKVAVDVSLFLCKFKAICGDKWIIAFINLVSCLRRNEIHCVFCYDNGSPIEKQEEKDERRRQAQKTEQRVIELEKSIENYEKTGIVDSILMDLYKKIMNKDVEQQPGRLLSTKNVEKREVVDISILKIEVAKKRNFILNISPSDFVITREMCDILQIPYYIAPLEAETMCADLCKRGLVDCVLSEDTDVLAYGAPIFLTKINTMSDTCVQINYHDILEKLQLHSHEFLDLCIMCGCDYNKNIPKIGCESSYKLIKTHKTIESIEEKTSYDVTPLKYKRTRELFMNYEKHPTTKVPFVGSPNFENLNLFFQKHGIKNLDIKKIMNNFVNNHNISFHDTMSTTTENGDDEDDTLSDLEEDSEETVVKYEETVVCEETVVEYEETVVEYEETVVDYEETEI